MELLQIEHRKILTHLQFQNEQMLKDNLVLVDEVQRLRTIITYYEDKDSKVTKQSDMYAMTADTIQKESSNIVKKIQNFESSNSKNFEKQLKQFQKQMNSKKMQQLEKKYEQKREECEKLKQFKERCVKLYNTYQKKVNGKDTERIYKWLKNQVIKSQSSTTKSTKKASKSSRDKGKPSRFKPEKGDDK